MKNLVCRLANRLVSNSGLNRSEAFRKAWQVVKGAKNPQVLTAFFASQGKVEARVIDMEWTAYTTPKGGASKPGLVVFADLEKVAMGKYAIRSARKENIVAA